MRDLEYTSKGLSNLLWGIAAEEDERFIKVHRLAAHFLVSIQHFNQVLTFLHCCFAKKT